MRPDIPEPWLFFLQEVDNQLPRKVEIHCIGAFALLLLLGDVRPTADIDFIEVIPKRAEGQLQEIGGVDSELSHRHRLHLDSVGVASYPCEYHTRLIEVTPNTFKNLKVKILEPHDLALSKISRNSPKDWDDVRLLVERGKIRADVLRERYMEEVRPYILVEERDDLTLELWLDEFFNDGSYSTKTYS